MYTYPDPGAPQPHAPLTAGSRSYSYDENGNTLSGGTKSYSWDGANRLIRVEGGITIGFIYAPDGNRWRKSTGDSPTQYFGADVELTGERRLRDGWV